MFFEVRRRDLLKTLGPPPGKPVPYSCLCHPDDHATSTFGVAIYHSGGVDNADAVSLLFFTFLCFYLLLFTIVSTWHKAPVAQPPGFLARRVAPELQLARLSEGDEKLEELWVEAVRVEMDIRIHKIC